MKKVLLLLLVAVCLFGASKKINVDFSGEFSLERTGKFFKGTEVQRIKVKSRNYAFSETKGEPGLPLISVNVAVPEGSSYEGVKFSFSNESKQNILLEATQEVIPTNQVESEYVYPDYSQKSDVFPASKVKYTGTHKLSNYTFFSFQIAPYSYDIKQNILTIFENVSFVVEYGTETKGSNIRKWDDGDFYTFAKGVVENPEDLCMPVKRAFSKSDVDHLIITNEALSNSFEALKDWRFAEGIVSEIITTETIYANYPGETNQLKIKNCLKDYYENKSLKWVVIGGDDTIVPDQNVYGVVNGDIEDYTIPADLFYACFDNQFDWNSDGDNKVGEPEDNTDMSPEIYIGRIPARTTADVAAYVNKMIDYEQNPPAEIAEKFLMTGCLLWENVGSVSDGEAKSEKMWSDFIEGNWTGAKYRLYDTNTDFGGASHDLTATNLKNAIDEGFGFVHMATHGNQTLWSTESGSYYYPNHALAQTNNKMGIVVTIACITNAFDADATATSSNCDGGPYMNDPALSEGFLRNPNGGAVGYLGSSRYGWGYGGGTAEHGPSFQYNDKFFYRLFTGQGQNSETERRFGAVAALAKMDQIANSGSNGASRWVMFTLNPMGDPALKICTTAEVSCQLTSPVNGSSYNIGETVSLTATAEDNTSKSITSVKFYANSVLLNEDFTSPYSYEWDTSSEEFGNYTIEAVATDNDGNSIQSSVTISLTPEIEIAFFDDFEAGQGDWEFGGDFELATPNGLGGSQGNADPSQAYSGSKVIGNDLTGNGDYDANLSDHETYAISPVINCSGHDYVLLEFQRFLNVEQPLYDHAYIDVWNGSNWQNIWTNDATVSDSEWLAMSYDISSIAANKSDVKVRFSLGSTDGGWEFSGWNIDDFKISYNKIDGANHAPIISSIDDCTIYENEDITLDFTVADADGDDLVVTAVSGNLTLLPQENIEFTGTGTNRSIKLAPAPNSSGSVLITLTVNDGVNKATAETSFNLLVNSLDSDIIVTELSYATEQSANNWLTVNQEISEGESLDFAILANDPDGNNLEYSWKLDNVEQSTESSYTFEADYDSKADYSITLAVTDNFGTKGVKNTLNFSWAVIVNNVNRAPSIDSYTPSELFLEVVTTEIMSFEVVASDLDEDDLTYSWELNGRLLGSNTQNCSYQFDEGINELVAIVSDGVSETRVTWTIESALGIAENIIPEKTRLFQNYPNPFNPSTSLSFDLKEDNRVSLAVYNYKGEKVRELLNSEMKAGSYQAKWDGKNSFGRKVASGVYFFKMQTAGYSKVIKGMLVK